MAGAERTADVTGVGPSHRDAGASPDSRSISRPERSRRRRRFPARSQSAIAIQRHHTRLAVDLDPPKAAPTKTQTGLSPGAERTSDVAAPLHRSGEFRHLAAAVAVEDDVAGE